jgi:hypothetical protein
VPSLDYVAALVAYYEERFDDALHRLGAINGEPAGLAWCGPTSSAGASPS